MTIRLILVFEQLAILLTQVNGSYHLLDCTLLKTDTTPQSITHRAEVRIDCWLNELRYIFQAWFNSIDHDNIDPYVPGLITSDWLHMHNNMGKRHMTWVCCLRFPTAYGLRSIEDRSSENNLNRLFFTFKNDRDFKYQKISDDS